MGATASSFSLHSTRPTNQPAGYLRVQSSPVRSKRGNNCKHTQPQLLGQTSHQCNTHAVGVCREEEKGSCFRPLMYQRAGERASERTRAHPLQTILRLSMCAGRGHCLGEEFSGRDSRLTASEERSDGSAGLELLLLHLSDSPRFDRDASSRTSRRPETPLNS